MSKISKSIKRDRKINKRKNGMKVDNKSIFTLEEMKKKRHDKIKAENKKNWEESREHDDAYSELIIKEGRYGQ